MDLNSSSSKKSGPESGGLDHTEHPSLLLQNEPIRKDDKRLKDPQQQEQINRILFMNLDDFEHTSRTVSQSSLTLTSSELFIQEGDNYMHQLFPSFLNESCDGDFMKSDLDHQAPTQLFKTRTTQNASEGERCDNGTTTSVTNDCLAPPTPKIAPLVQLYYSRPRIPNSSSFAVVQISNISPETTMQDIDSFCSPVSLIHCHVSPYFTECVHLLFASSERPQGKNEAFIEFPTEDLAKAFIRQAKRVLKKRLVAVKLSSQGDLLNALFPDFKIEVAKSEIENGHIFVSREEIMDLVHRCRSKVASKRQYLAVERAIDTIVSIISKIPWHFPDALSTLQRDHLFELCKLTTEAMMYQSVKARANHLRRVVNASLCVPLFTEKQKLMIMNTAQMQVLSREMIPYVYISDESLCIHEAHSPCSCSNSPEGSLGSKASPNTTMDGVPDALIVDPVELARDDSHLSGPLGDDDESLSTLRRINDRLQERASRADQLISSLRQENQEFYGKYLNCLYSMQELREKYDFLVNDYLVLQRKNRDAIEKPQPPGPTTLTPPLSSTPGSSQMVCDHLEPPKQYECSFYY